jgi:hypothetical protein
MMLGKTQRIVLLMLLASYLLVGALAHLEALTQFLGFGVHPHQVARSKPVRRAPAKVYWTQYKHIRAVTKASAPSAAVFHTPQATPDQQYDRLPAAPASAIRPQPHYSSSSPRAPPES